MRQRLHRLVSAREPRCDAPIWAERTGRQDSPLALTPDPIDLVARARADLRMGLGIVLTGARGGALVLSAETLREDRLDAARGLGAAVVALTGALLMGGVTVLWLGWPT